MNRIILVGNGFDLAHGLKSSYKDFVLDLIKQKIAQAFQEGTKNNFKANKVGYFYEDDLLSIHIPSYSNIKEFISLISKFDHLDEIKQVSNGKSLELKIKSKILSDFFENWADFEKSFFDCLVRTYQENGDIKKLNAEFSLIRKYLKEYIHKIQIDIESEEFEITGIDKVKEIFCEGKLNSILFLSFNYTRTLGFYFNEIQKKISSRIIYLHGNVNDHLEDDELIFGFDNNLDENFNKILSNSQTEYLNFFKSVLYSNTTNKRELVDFLALGKFDVYSFGHSLDVSDFTILREIFSHNNCTRIKIYCHPENRIEDYNKKRNLLRQMLIDINGGFSKLAERSVSTPMPILISKAKELKF
jgi:hypothetical protein